MPASGITEDKDTGDFFDNIDDLFNFPNEDVEGGFVEDYDSVFQDNEYVETGFVGDGNSSLLGIEEFNDRFAGAFHFSELFDTHMAAPKALEEPLGHDMVACGNDSNQTSDIHNEFSIPYEELWLSNYVADVDSNFTVNDDEITSDNKKEFHKFRASSPVSVLDSSSSCSEEKIKRLSPETIVPGRARSKRPRPANFSPRPVIPLVSPSSSVTESAQPFCVSEESVEFDNFSESCDSPAKKGTKTYVTKIVGQEEKKMKRKNLSLPFGTLNTDKYPLRQPSAIRKCMHCEVTSTPQWRAGPMGPKTLCNACGVRYKSGRLFPEYRPAASPTFVASLHSNSHKKVLEMRTKVGDDITTGTTAIPDLIPNHNHVLNYI